MSVTEKRASATTMETNTDGESQEMIRLPSPGHYTLTVLGGFCCFFTSFGWINSIGVFQQQYQEQNLLRYSPSSIAWIQSVEVFLMFACGPIFGAMSDCSASTYLLLFGSAVHVLGLLMLSIASEYWHFLLAQGFCSAIGSSAIFYAGTTQIGFLPKHKAGLFYGLASSGSSIGGIVYPIVFNNFQARFGFGWGVRAVGLTSLIVLIGANLSLRRGPLNSPAKLSNFKTHFKDTTFMLICLASFFFCFGMFIPWNFVSVYARAEGLPSSLVPYLIPIMNGGGFFGRLALGFLADQLGYMNIMVLTTLCTSAIVLILWPLAVTSLKAIIFALFYGMLSGAFVSLSPALMVQISDPHRIGTRNGIQFGFISIAVLLGNPVCAQLLTIPIHGRLGLQLFGGALILLGSLTFMVIRWRFSLSFLVKV